MKSGEIWAGVPAKLLRSISADEKGFVAASADNYARIATEHRWVHAVTHSSPAIFCCSQSVQHVGLIACFYRLWGPPHVEAPWWWGETPEVQGADVTRNVFGGLATSPVCL